MVVLENEIQCGDLVDFENQIMLVVKIDSEKGQFLGVIIEHGIMRFQVAWHYLRHAQHHKGTVKVYSKKGCRPLKNKRMLIIPLLGYKYETHEETPVVLYQEAKKDGYSAPEVRYKEELLEEIKHCDQVHCDLVWGSIHPIQSPGEKN